MLEAADAGRQPVADPADVVCVSQHVGLAGLGLGHHGAQLLHRELDVLDAVGRGDDASRHRHLQLGGAPAEDLACCQPGAVRAVDPHGGLDEAG